MKKTSLFSVLVNYFSCGVFLMLAIMSFVIYTIDAIMEHSVLVLVFDHLKFAIGIMLTIYFYKEGNSRYKEYQAYEQSKKPSDNTQAKQLLQD